MADEVTETEPSANEGLIDDLSPAMPPVEISIWWYLGPLIVLAVVALVSWRLRAKIKAKYDQLTAPPPPNPAKDAREALELLRREMDGMDMRLFINRLSAILRAYIEGRFKMRVTSQTTREFLNAASKGSRFDADSQSKIQEFLETCDRAKFAHLTVPEETGNQFLDWVESYIASTEKASKAEGAQ